MKPATTAAAVLLCLVAILHALRLVFAAAVTVEGLVVPMWVSVLGTIVPAVLAVGMWREHAPPRHRSAA